MSCIIVFFFKQKTAYEMRISDWSSDVCSSDLRRVVVGPRSALAVATARLSDINWLAIGHDAALTVKVRSMAKPVPARFDGERIMFDAPEYGVAPGQAAVCYARSEEHTSELQSLMRISYAVFCLKKKTLKTNKR